MLLVLNRTRIEFELLLNCRESTIHSSPFFLPMRRSLSMIGVSFPLLM